MLTTASSTTPRPAARRRLRTLAGLALTVAALVSTGCSGTDPGPAAAKAPAATASAASAASDVPKADPASDREDAAAAALVVRPTQDVEVYDEPDVTSASRVVPATTSFGSATALLVTDRAPGWVQVLVPGRPTGARAWLPNGEAGSFQSVSMEIHIDLDARTMVLIEDDAEVMRTEVAIGSPDTPTPTGTFSVTDKLDSQEPGGAYGRYAVGLSARSEVITEFAGGDGQIGIHGTNEAASIGNAVSAGCIRAPQEVMYQLNAVLSLGTPVVVS